MSTRYNKLVRDKIPAILHAKGLQYNAKTLSPAEYAIALEQKLQEEVQEYLTDKNGEELADILEVVYALAESLGISPEALQKIREHKAGERGAFKDKVFLQDVAD